METVTITGLDRMRDPQPTLKGHLILAYFTADIGPLTVKGCALVREFNGRLAAWLPNMSDTKAKTLRSINFNDDKTRETVLRQALHTFRQLGGKTDVRVAALQTMQPPPSRSPLNDDDGEDRAGLKSFLQSKGGDDAQDVA